MDFNSFCLNKIMVQVDELLKERESIHSSFTAIRPVVNSSGSAGSGGGSSKVPNDEASIDSPAMEDGSVDGKDKSNKKKWFNLNLSRSDKKA